MPKTPPDLPALLRFTEADLAANRSGTISPAQNARIQRQRVQMAVTTFILSVVLAIATGLIAAAEADPSAATIRTIILLLGAGFTVVSFWRTWHIWTAPISLSSLSGEVRTQPESDVTSALRGLAFLVDILALLTGNAGTSGAGAQRNYQLRVGDEKLSVDQKTFEAFWEGGQYHLYYVEMPLWIGKKVLILSAEPITDAAATTSAY